MKTFHWFFILISLWAASLFAQNDADKNYSYLQTVFNRHDKHLRDFMVAELQNYLATFADSSHAADAQFLLGKVLDEKGKKYAAFASYLKAVIIYPGSKPYPECVDNVRYFLGKEKKVGDKKNEILRFLDSPAADSSKVDRYFTYCKMLTEFSKKEFRDQVLDALHEFSRLFPNDPRNDQITAWMADTFFLNGDKYEADATYQKLDIVFPASGLLPYALYRRGELLSRKLGQHQTAVQVLGQVADRYPESEYAPQSLLLMGQIKEKKTKDYQGAKDDYGKLVENYPDDPSVYNALWAIAGINKNKLKDYSAAINTLDEIVAKDSTNIRDIQALEEIAGINKKYLKDYGKAAETLVRLVDMFPEYEKAPDRLMDAASLYEKQLGDYQKALGYYQLVVDKFSSSKKAGDAAKRIEKLQEKVAPVAEEEKVNEEPPSQDK